MLHIHNQLITRRKEPQDDRPRCKKNKTTKPQKLYIVAAVHSCTSSLPTHA